MGEEITLFSGAPHRKEKNHAEVLHFGELFCTPKPLMTLKISFLKK